MSWAHLPLVKSWKKRPGLKKRETEKMRYNTPGPRPLRVHHKLDRESERPSPAELLFLILLWCTGRSGEWCTWGRGWDTKGFRAALAAEVRNQTCSTWKTNRHKNMSKIKADLFNVPSNCLFATWLQVGHSSTEGFKKKRDGFKVGEGQEECTCTESHDLLADSFCGSFQRRHNEHSIEELTSHVRP